MSFLYEDKPAIHVGDAVRFLVGDTDRKNSQNISDGELLFILKRYGFDEPTDTYLETQHATLLQMALEAGRALVTKYASEAHYAVGGMNESANQKGVELRKRVNELARLVARTTRPRLVGDSKAAKGTRTANTDFVQSVFKKDMFDNVAVDRT